MKEQSVDKEIKTTPDIIATEEQEPSLSQPLLNNAS